jgi:hypothetical protein
LPGEETDQSVVAVKSIQNVHLPYHESKKEENTLNIESKQVSTKIQTLRSSKKSAKTRLTKAKKQLNDLIEKQLPGLPLPSKNAIRRAINKVNSEISIIEKIISGLKEIYAASAENEETNTVIETLELEDIGSSVDSIIVMAEQHLEERLGNGETDSELTSLRSQETSPQSPVMSKKSSNVEQKQKEANEASERLIQMENEQRVKDLELQKLTTELQLRKQRTDDARKVAALNKSRAEEAERRSQVSDNDTVQNFLINRHLVKHSELPNENKEQRQTFSPIRLKGVDLPIFSGEEKSDFESWKAAFLSVVDRRDIPVGEKMLRLQGCLSGKALTMVKDLGYSLNAYERAKAKLEVPGHFAERHFAERHFAERHLAERTFCRRTFCRTDVLPNGHFAERTICRTDNLPKIEILFRQKVWDCASFLNFVILNHCVK